MKYLFDNNEYCQGNYLLKNNRLLLLIPHIKFIDIVERLYEFIFTDDKVIKLFRMNFSNVFNDADEINLDNIRLLNKYINITDTVNEPEYKKYIPIFKMIITNKKSARF